MESATQTKVYPAVGRCIYCGTDKGKLTKEHIVPLGLGGNWILPRASCRTCAKVTSSVEQFCLRQMLGPLRIRTELPTRHPKNRPDKLPLEYIRIDGRREKEIVPAHEVPIACLGYRFPAPGLLRGLPPNDDTCEGELVARFIGEEIHKHIRPEGQRVKIGTINISYFRRMLAKIAHSYAVANLGLSAFRPLLPDLVLGRSATESYLVGGDVSIPTRETEPFLHHVYLQNCLTGGVEYILVAIHLFAVIGMPRYHVVVGEKLKE